MTYTPYAIDNGPAATEILASSVEGIFDRHLITSQPGISNGNMRGTYFTCRRSQTITSIRTLVGGTNQTAATLCRIGLYTVDASDNLTLVASTANDTNLWNSANATVDKALSSSYAVKRGTRYAVGLLVVGSSQAPTIGALQLTNSAPGQASPRLAFLIGSQTDLPSSIATGSMTGANILPWAALVP